MIPNPEFQGAWKAKMIKNPNYKGKWEAPEIDNPDYKPDDSLYAFKDLKFVGFELWQVSMQPDALKQPLEGPPRVIEGSKHEHAPSPKHCGAVLNSKL